MNDLTFKIVPVDAHTQDNHTAKRQYRVLADCAATQERDVPLALFARRKDAQQAIDDAAA